jgi:hypothetical protein
MREREGVEDEAAMRERKEERTEKQKMQDHKRVSEIGKSDTM